MIQKYTHTQIDKERYTLCLQSAINYWIYAELWYLDTVSPTGYDIWVLNDFQAIMPVTYQKKAGVKFVIQPPFCQQLGVFYSDRLTLEDFTIFTSHLQKYRVRSYSFNEDNNLYFPDTIKRDNQVLSLHTSYDQLSKRFNSNRKREIYQCSQQNLHITEQFELNALLENMEDNFFPFSNKEIKLAEELAQKLHKKKAIESLFLKDESGNILASLILLISSDRLISLLPLRSKKTIQKGAITFLYNHVIQKYSYTNKIIDFEGSMLSGIAKFNKSLGAITHEYVTYSNYKWFELLKKSL